MKSREKIYSRVLQNRGKYLSPEDIKRLDPVTEFYENTARDYCEKRWSDRDSSFCEEEQEQNTLEYIKENVLPYYKKISPKIAAALQAVIDVDPHFINNGGISNHGWARIKADYGKKVMNDCKKIVAGLIDLYKKTLKESHDAYINTNIEKAIDHYADEIIRTALGEIGYDERRE